MGYVRYAEVRTVFPDRYDLFPKTPSTYYSPLDKRPDFDPPIKSR